MRNLLNAMTAWGSTPLIIPRSLCFLVLLFVGVLAIGSLAKAMSPPLRCPACPLCPTTVDKGAMFL